jgi:hypothetical protein
MGFGIDVKVEVPKVEVPKVEVPKVDVGAAVTGAASAATGAVASAVGAATAGASAALGSATKAAASLAGTAGALADVAVSFTGPCVDLVLEPHLVLDANASYADTGFEKGPVRIRIDLTAAEAAEHGDTLRLFSGTGSYDQSKRISDYVESTEATIVVRFEAAPMNETFSLQVIPAQGEPHLVFSGVPYGDLRKTKQRFPA